MKQFENKVAIVTGGGSGFGKAMSKLYAQEGACVIVADIDPAGGEATAHEIEQAGSKALFVKADASSPDDCENLVKQVVSNYGKLNLAFNNAGIGGASAPIGEYPIDAWDKLLKPICSAYSTGCISRYRKC